MPSEMLNSWVGSGERVIFGVTLARKSRIFCFHSSAWLEVCCSNAEANILRKSYSLRHEKMSRCTILMFLSSIVLETCLTSDVFPILLGEIMMVLTPYLKFAERRSISFSLPMKCLESTEIPKTKGFERLAIIDWDLMFCKYLSSWQSAIKYQ